jgi:hypothetical protein
VITYATPAEPVDVTVDVASTVSPTTILRHAVLGRRDGLYGYAWNGRTDANATVAAGTYRVTHHYLDLFGNAIDHVFTVTVSAKRLHYTTVAKTLLGSQRYLTGHGGSGSVKFSGTTAVVRSGTGWAAVNYKTKLVSATVCKSVQFEVSGKSSNSRKVQIGIWNHDLGPASNVLAYDDWRSIGPRKAAWKTATVAAGAHVTGRVMYGVVYAPKPPGGSVTFYVYKVRLIYTYGVLK